MAEESLNSLKHYNELKNELESNRIKADNAELEKFKQSVISELSSLFCTNQNSRYIYISKSLYLDFTPGKEYEKTNDILDIRIPTSIEDPSIIEKAKIFLENLKQKFILKGYDAKCCYHFNGGSLLEIILTRGMLKQKT